MFISYNMPWNITVYMKTVRYVIKSIGKKRLFGLLLWLDSFIDNRLHVTINLFVNLQTMISCVHTCLCVCVCVCLTVQYSQQVLPIENCILPPKWIILYTLLLISSTTRLLDYYCSTHEDILVTSSHCYNHSMLGSNRIHW